MTLQASLSSLRPITGSYQHLAPTAATGLTVPAGATAAYISVSTASVTFRDDGTAPTTAAGGGVILPVTNAPWLYQGDLTKIQFISATGLVDVLYYAAN